MHKVWQPSFIICEPWYMFLLSTVLLAQQNIDKAEERVCRDPAFYLLSAAETRVKRVANKCTFLSSCLSYILEKGLQLSLERPLAVCVKVKKKKCFLLSGHCLTSLWTSLVIYPSIHHYCISFFLSRCNSSVLSWFALYFLITFFLWEVNVLYKHWQFV